MQRVDINKLSFKSDEDEYCDDYFAFYEGKPFTGIAFENKESGYRYEETFKEGQLHGKSIGFFPNGQKHKEGNYFEGLEVGEHYEWYESGQLKEYNEYEKSSSPFITRQWNESGILVFEILEKEKIWRRWYKSGELLMEKQGDKTKYYNKENELAIEHKSYDYHGDVTWYDQALEKSYMQMAEEPIVDGLVWRWLHRKLDSDVHKYAYLLCALIEYPSSAIQKIAMSNAISYCLKEAVPFLKKELGNTSGKISSDFFSKTVGEHAKAALDKIEKEVTKCP